MGLGGIQFCKLLVLSKLENCKAAACLALFLGACIAHTRGCWLVAYIHRAAKNSKDSHESSKPPRRVSRIRTRVLPCSSLDTPAWNKRKYHERRRSIARHPLNGSFLRVWGAVGCCQANSSCCGGNGENCCSKSNWFSHVP